MGLIHTDKDRAIIEHCAKFHVDIKVVNASGQWLYVKPRDPLHPQRHREALDYPDPDRLLGQTRIGHLIQRRQW
jgi:hypothetical protein